MANYRCTACGGYIYQSFMAALQNVNLGEIPNIYVDKKPEESSCPYCGEHTLVSAEGEDRQCQT